MDILTYGALLNKVKEAKPTDEQVAQAVEGWLDDHPEATTTVQDGSITHAKLDSDLQDAVDEIPNLKSQITTFTGNTEYTGWEKDKWIKYTAPQTQVREIGWQSILVPCKQGDIFYVKGYGGGSPRLWCFSDSQANAIQYSGAVNSNGHFK